MGVTTSGLPHRIAAGAIVIQHGKILLVRYPESNGRSFLVAPGGAAEQNESVTDTAVRETLEETGLIVAAQKVLCIEDLLCDRFRMCKIWMLCGVIGGQLKKTQGARQEGIVEAKWYGRRELQHETVFPSIITECAWSSFASDNWVVRCLGLRRAIF